MKQAEYSYIVVPPQWHYSIPDWEKDSVRVIVAENIDAAAKNAVEHEAIKHGKESGLVVDVFVYDTTLHQWVEFEATL